MKHSLLTTIALSSALTTSSCAPQEFIAEAKCPAAEIPEITPPVQQPASCPSQEPVDVYTRVTTSQEAVQTFAACHGSYEGFKTYLEITKAYNRNSPLYPAELSCNINVNLTRIVAEIIDICSHVTKSAISYQTGPLAPDPEEQKAVISKMSKDAHVLVLSLIRTHNEIQMAAPQCFPKEFKHKNKLRIDSAF